MSDPHKAKILVVDDESLTCALLQEYFAGAYQVETACNGSEVLRKLKAFQPDCILLDIRMSDMGGIEVLKAIKPLHSGMKVIMVTAVGCADVARECLRLGAFAYAMKPLDLDELEAKIQSALAQQKDERDKDGRGKDEG